MADGLRLDPAVESGSWFGMPLHPKGIAMECFGYRAGMRPELERACAEVVNLPTHWKITPYEAERVLTFLGKHARFV